MKCPACGSSRVFHSRPKSFRDRVLKRALPITFYRCHDCGWRRFRMVQGWKGFASYALSLIGYAATLALAVAVIGGVIVLTLTFLGVQMPWNR
jgi:DNA-directed RNA polymerase subunit RPC12/RpoP